jgi:DNA adenine methylase
MKKLSSPFPWVGGKRLLREHIISLIPEHRCYIEAFAGGAWVYWGKEPSKVEVINDINGDLINLYKQIQTNHEAFYDRLWWILNSRDEYYRLLSTLKNTKEILNDLDRAVYYFYVIKCAFGGRFGSGYAFSKKQPPRSAVGHDTLCALSDRLHNTFIENLSFERLIKNYDYEDSFFYCDPPFTCSDNRNDYEHTMTEERHQLLRDTLGNLKGKFLLSYDDVPMIRKLYKGFKIEKTKPILYTLNQNHRYKHELLIRNY